MSIKSRICPLHLTEVGCEDFWSFVFAGETWNLTKCTTCDLVFYNPFPEIDYSSHTDSIASIRDYVHLNSNIEGLIYNIVQSVPKGKFESIIEIGCGFGFTLDYCRRALKMNAIGFEPSLYGEYGARELGVKINRGYFSEEISRYTKADIIFASEVLEHVTDPASFINLLKSGLNEEGVLILTTPDYKLLQRDMNNPSELALLSPGAHVVLFSEASLRKLLQKAGFSYIHVRNSGNSLVVACSVTEKDWSGHVDIEAALQHYYELLINQLPKESLAYTGVQYRLFRWYIDRGYYKGAQQLISNYPLPELPSLKEISDIHSLADFDRVEIACATLLYYYKGIYELNLQHNFSEAADCFENSYEMIKKKLLFKPESSVIEYSMLWLAKYHQALAVIYDQNRQYGKAILDEIIHFEKKESNSYLPFPDTQVLKLAKKLLETC